MPDPEWLHLFRRCVRPGCEWHILADPDEGSRCHKHGGDPIAAFRSDPEGATTWHTRKERDVVAES